MYQITFLYNNNKKKLQKNYMNELYGPFKYSTREYINIKTKFYYFLFNDKGN